MMQAAITTMGIQMALFLVPSSDDSVGPNESFKSCKSRTVKLKFTGATKRFGEVNAAVETSLVVVKSVAGPKIL